MQASVMAVAQSTVDISRLRCFELFKPLTDRELAAIARCCRQACHRADTLILRQGEAAREVFFLEDGAVNVYSEKLGQIRRIALIEAPGIFGEMALMNRDKIRTATVRAATDVQVLAITFPNMIAALRAIPALKEQLRLLVRERSTGVKPVPAETDPTKLDDIIIMRIESLCS